MISGELDAQQGSLEYGIQDVDRDLGTVEGKEVFCRILLRFSERGDGSLAYCPSICYGVRHIDHLVRIASAGTRETKTQVISVRRGDEAARVTTREKNKLLLGIMVSRMHSDLQRRFEQDATPRQDTSILRCRWEIYTFCIFSRARVQPIDLKVFDLKDVTSKGQWSQELKQAQTWAAG